MRDEAEIRELRRRIAGLVPSLRTLDRFGWIAAVVCVEALDWTLGEAHQGDLNAIDIFKQKCKEADEAAKTKETVH